MPSVNDAESFFDELCLGNKAAAEFCRGFYNYVQWLDDAVDKDKSYTVEETARLTLETVFIFAENPFFQEHSSFILPIIVQSVLAWESSEEFASQKENYCDFIASQVLKSQYHEVFWHVALICGGIGHARRILKSHRKFDYDLLPAPVQPELDGQRHVVPEPL
jgi:hypothetical protein